MKKTIKITVSFILACIISISFVACKGRNDSIDNNPETPVTGDSKILISYFSWSGNTQQLANMISEKTGGELFRIVPEEAYATDFDGCADRAQTELRNETRPSLSSHVDTEIMAGYDVIFVGFPIWWYDLPMPVWTFLEEYDFSGKTIIPFFSHNGSSSGASSISTIKRLCPGSTVADNYLSVRGSSVGGAKGQVTEWINKLGIKTKE